jgi:hypothetical protein
MLRLARQLGNDPLRGFLDLARTYGNVVMLRVGPFKFCLLNQPDLVREVLVVQAKGFCKPERLKRNLAAIATICLTPAAARAARVSGWSWHRVSVNALVGIKHCSTSNKVAKFSAPIESARATTSCSRRAGSSAISFLTLRETPALEETLVAIAQDPAQLLLAFEGQLGVAMLEGYAGRAVFRLDHDGRLVGPPACAGFFVPGAHNPQDLVAGQVELALGFFLGGVEFQPAGGGLAAVLAGVDQVRIALGQLTADIVSAA